MNRIDRTFARLRTQGRKALIPFVTAGFPSVAATQALLPALVRAGADLIELGVPFSDPMADGPTIQHASERALAQGMTLAQVFDVVRDFRRTDADTPVVLMGYANPIEAMGEERFVQAARDAGVDGVLTVDYPPQEAESFAARLRAAGLHPIFLLAPTSKPERADEVARLGGGYVYYVSLTGVTGAGSLDVAAVLARIPALREHTGLPVAVGFGIRDARTAAEIGAVADAVVIGSRLLEALEGAEDPAEACWRAEEFLCPIRRALDEGVAQ
ncbi:MAG: tryptophan synthase subunit alpha [Rhodocyclales bacterium]|nr:tryptophan synthase subunit alpha [Rhodocyclales bacterium]